MIKTEIITKYRKYSDLELVKACIKQKRQAQQELYQRFSYMVKGVCLRYSTNSQEAEDLMQDSFVKVFKNLKSFSGKGALGGWVRQITVNTALELYRKNKLNIQSLEIENNTQFTNDNSIEQLELNDLLLKIQSLPTGFRTIFNLYAVEGYNHREIGKLLNISEGTSKSQYSRARGLLRQMILDDNKHEKRILKYAK